MNDKKASAQQVAEESLKALAYSRGSDFVKTHSVIKLTKELKLEEPFSKYASTLDLYYISTRYPDALPDGDAPSEYFSKSQAEETLNFAENFLIYLRKELDS